jgi:hypothetical protein
MGNDKSSKRVGYKIFLKKHKDSYKSENTLLKPYIKNLTKYINGIINK